MRHAIRHLKQCDPVLAEIIGQIGPFKPAQRPANFEAMARSIVFQQLAGAAARTIFERLRKACEQTGVGAHEISPFDGGYMMTPEAILALSEAQLRACGLSKQKLSYVRDLAEKTLSGDVDFARMPEWTDEEVIEHLTRVKGIGVWSAQMFLIFALGRLDVMPTVDLGINTAIVKAYRKRKMPKPKQILALAEQWRPYRSLACWYLWRYVEWQRTKRKAANGKAKKKA